MDLLALDRTRKMVKMVNVLLCVFYHNERRLQMEKVVRQEVSGCHRMYVLQPLYFLCKPHSNVPPQVPALFPLKEVLWFQKSQ